MDKQNEFKKSLEYKERAELYKAVGYDPAYSEIGPDQRVNLDKWNREREKESKSKIIDISDHLDTYPNYYRSREQQRRRRIRNSKAKEAQRKFKGRITALLLSGAIALGGFAVGSGIYGSVQGANKPITTKHAIYLLGETPKSLGIRPEIYNEIQGIEELLQNDNLSDEQITQMAPRIYHLCIDSTKSKLASTLGVNENDISLTHRNAEEGTTVQTVTVKSNHQNTVYRSKDFLTFNNSISDEIADSIKDASRMQEIMSKIQSGNYNREELLSTYREIVNNVDQFSAMKLKVDDRGNISVDTTRMKDMESLLSRAYNDVKNNTATRDMSQENDTASNDQGELEID